MSAVNIVQRFSGAEPVDVAEASPSVALPMTSIAMLPGVYWFNDSGYDCTAPGLYLFTKKIPTAPIFARLVYGGDLYAFLAGVSWHHIHGLEDEYLTGQALANAGMGHKWRLRCGAISAFMKWLLPQYGLSTRVIQLLSLEQPPSSVDQGHIVFEVSHGGKWKMWDITNGEYFTDSNGVHLSAAEIIAAGVLNCTRVAIDGDEKRGGPVTWDAQGQPWCMSSYFDLAYRTQAQRDAWHARVYQSWSVIP